MFDVVERLREASPPDRLARQAVRARADSVLRPAGALARLDEVAVWLAGWQRTDTPRVDRPTLILAAGDHGVVDRGVSAYPAQVTGAMVDAIRAGVATSAVMARELGVALRLVDAGVGVPTGDLTVGPAMDGGRFETCFRKGWDLVGGLDTDLVLIGEMGIGNTTAAAALAAGLFGGPALDWVGRGAGVDDDGFQAKLSAVETAAERCRGVEDGFELAAHLGGTELAVLAGVAARTRVEGIPLVLDGFVSTAAVAPLTRVAQGALDHCLAAHLSPEPGHRLLLDRLGLAPLLDLEMRLGEGSGALVAVPLLRLACAAVVDVATFAEWGLA